MFLFLENVHYWIKTLHSYKRLVDLGNPEIYLLSFFFNQSFLHTSSKIAFLLYYEISNKQAFKTTSQITAEGQKYLAYSANCTISKYVAEVKSCHTRKYNNNV